MCYKDGVSWYLEINYTILDELHSGKGYADVVYIPKPLCNTAAFIVKLKYLKNTFIGMKQIIDRNYSTRLHHYKKNLLLVSINYDKDSPNKKHTCLIRKYNERKKLKTIFK